MEVPRLVQGSEAPVYSGFFDSGSDHVCAGCKQSVLAENITKRDLVDIEIQCGKCGHVEYFPDLEAGEPLPSSICIYPAEYECSGTIDGNERGVLASARALERRALETGSLGMQSVEGDTPTEVLSNAQAIVQEALGSGYEKMKTDADKARNHGQEPPHRLMRIIDEARSLANSLGEESPVVEVAQIDAACELLAIAELFQRWSQDPRFNEILPSLKDASMHAHTLITLVTASYLLDLGNAIGFQREEEDDRTADLKIAIGPNTDPNVEIKCPEVLQDRSEGLDRSKARKLIRRKLSEAGTDAAGQLDPSQPGIFVLGALGLADSALDTLESTAQDLLRERGPDKPHLAAILIVASKTHVSRGESVSFNPSFEIRVARNPDAEAQIVVEEVPEEGRPSTDKVRSHSPGMVVCHACDTEFDTNDVELEETTQPQKGLCPFSHKFLCPGCASRQYLNYNTEAGRVTYSPRLVSETGEE